MPVVLPCAVPVLTGTMRVAADHADGSAVCQPVIGLQGSVPESLSKTRSSRTLCRLLGLGNYSAIIPPFSARRSVAESRPARAAKIAPQPVGFSYSSAGAGFATSTASGRPASPRAAEAISGSASTIMPAQRCNAASPSPVSRYMPGAGRSNQPYTLRRKSGRHRMLRPAGPAAGTDRPGASRHRRAPAADRPSSPAAGSSRREMDRLGDACAR